MTGPAAMGAPWRMGAGRRAIGSTLAGRHARAALSLLFAGAFLLALAPRLVALGLFPTSDEDSWMRRAGGFSYGLLTGQLGRTYQNGHPGVTTMWTAVLSLGPEEAARFADRVHGLRYVAQVPGYLEALARARVGFALLSALSIGIATLLAVELFGRPAAALGGLGLAAEPFLVANGQLVHVDGPLTAFMAVAALAALVYARRGGGLWLMALAGVSTGLALLSKSPAVFLLGFVPLVLLAGAPVGGLTPCLRALAVWLAGAVGVVLALWPAIWALGPLEVFSRVAAFTRETGGAPDEVGSFFLGRIGSDPGPLYYPVATLFRLSPFAVLGLIALAVAWRGASPERRPALIWLMLFILGFGLMMTLGPKKFDRYMLPIFPPIVLLAGVGWSLALARLRSTWAGAAGVAGLVVLAAVPLASVYPYPLAFYSPLLGGGAAAQRAVMVGNGEGLDQVARWISAQPGASESRAAAHSFDILAAMIPGDGEPLRDGIPDDADYIVTYGRRIQMHRWGPSLDRYLSDHPPLYRVWINGIEYARVHPGPRQTNRPG